MGDTAVLHPSNITGSPASTFAGIGLIATQIGGMIQTQGLPTSTAGWVTFGLSIFGGLFAVLGRG